MLTKEVWNHELIHNYEEYNWFNDIYSHICMCDHKFMYSKIDLCTGVADQMSTDGIK